MEEPLMLENGVINRFQLWLLEVNFTIGSALLIIPSTIVAKSKQDGWISMFLGILLAIGLTYIMVSLAEKFPNQTLVGITETLLGTMLGKGIGLLYAWFFLHLSALVMRNATDFITTAIFPETPMILFSIMAGVLLYIVINQGIEGIGRSNEFFSLFTSGGFWITLFLLIPEMNFKNVYPIFAEGFKPVLRGTVPTIGFPFAETIAFLMFLPFVNQRKRIKSVFISGVVVGGLSLFFVVLGTILVLNVRPTEMSLFATFNMARLIDVGRFLTRVEAVIALSYMLTIFIKMTISFYAGILVIAQVFHLSDYRPIAMPLVFIVVALSVILNKNIVETFEFATTTWTPYALMFGFVIPSILLAISYFKQKR